LYTDDEVGDRGMAKAAEYAPRIRERLEASTTAKPVTVQELAQHVGCSVQQVYKVLQQLGTKKTVVGQSPTGAYLYSYDPEGREAPRGFERKVGEVAKGGEVGDVPAKGGGRGRPRGKREPRKAVLQMNDLVTIKGIREATGGGIEVEFENDAGERVRAVVVESNG
jgi:hypothetical protein